MGRQYAGGHETAKVMLEDHGKKFVKVAKAQLVTYKGNSTETHQPTISEGITSGGDPQGQEMKEGWWLQWPEVKEMRTSKEDRSKISPVYVTKLHTIGELEQFSEISPNKTKK